MFLPVLWKHDYQKVIGKLLHDIISHKNLIVFEPRTVTKEMLESSTSGLAFRVLEWETVGDTTYIGKVEVLEISL